MATPKDIAKSIISLLMDKEVHWLPTFSLYDGENVCRLTWDNTLHCTIQNEEEDHSTYCIFAWATGPQFKDIHSKEFEFTHLPESPEDVEARMNEIVQLIMEKIENERI